MGLVELASWTFFLSCVRLRTSRSPQPRSSPILTRLLWTYGTVCRTGLWHNKHSRYIMEMAKWKIYKSKKLHRVGEYKLGSSVT